MSAWIRNLLSLAFLCAGISILWLGFGGRWLQSDAPEPSGDLASFDQPADETFAPAALWDSGLRFLPEEPPASGLLAVFLITPQICPTTLNDLHEYAQLLEPWREKGLDLESVVIVLGEDPERTRNLARALNLPWTVGYGWSESLRKALSPYHDSESSQQLVFLDLEERKIFHRALLTPNGTDPDYKRDVLKRLFALS